MKEMIDASEKMAETLSKLGDQLVDAVKDYENDGKCDCH